MGFELITDNLNPAQRQGVETILGPVLVLAGAGSGKTRVLTHRIANIIAQGEAAPDEILAVTFTNKAAREMQERTRKLLFQLNIPLYSNSLWISTFHSTCVRILRQHLGLLGYAPHWVIYDDGDQEKMLKKVINEMGVNEKAYPPDVCQGRINKAKSLGLTPNEVASHPQFLMDERSIEIYEAYEAGMFSANALDFSDLLLKTYEIFRRHPDVLDRYRRQFKFILVDEYQDTNAIQYKLIYLLAEHHKNLCAVGDEDQSIYSWRGADIGNIFSFERDFPNCKVIKLEQNYRSTQTIVRAASTLIRNNSLRKDKSLFSENELGDKIEVNASFNEYEEARQVVREIKDLCDYNRYRYKDIAIFYRTNAQSRVIEEQLRSTGIPYRMFGGVKFYERKEVKDVLSYLRFLLNPADTISFKRILNVPRRGIGDSTLDKLEQFNLERKVNWVAAVEQAVEEGIFNSGTAKKLLSFATLIKSLRDEVEKLKPSHIHQLILEKTGYLEELKKQDSLEAESRINNLGEFQNAIIQYEEERGDEASLKDFLEEMALATDMDRANEDADSVTMMTLHISKGLEFPVVFVIGMEEGLFPSHRSEELIDAMEEERRLAYVGMTRARKKLYLSFARNRRMWGQEMANQPSRFISEIPDEFYKAPPSFLKPRTNWMDNQSPESFPRSPRVSALIRKAKQSLPAKDFIQAVPDYEDFSDANGSNSNYRKGMKVRHPTYGVGSIVFIEGEGENEKLSVMFPNHQIKKFVSKFARLERV